MTRLGLLLVSMLTLLVGPTSSAQDGANGTQTPDADTPKAFEITGRWEFETEWYADNTRKLKGEMVVRRNEAGAMSCRITNGEYEQDNDTALFNAVQSCVVRSVNGALLIRSTVVEADTDGYRPDHFDLRVVDSDTMMGRAFSWMNLGAVKFTRFEQMVS